MKFPTFGLFFNRIYHRRSHVKSQANDVHSDIDSISKANKLLTIVMTKSTLWHFTWPFSFLSIRSQVLCEHCFAWKHISCETSKLELPTYLSKKVYPSYVLHAVYHTRRNSRTAWRKGTKKNKRLAWTRMWQIKRPYPSYPLIRTYPKIALGSLWAICLLANGVSKLFILLRALHVLGCGEFTPMWCCILYLLRILFRALRANLQAFARRNS